MNSPLAFHIDPPAIADTGDELSIQIKFRNRMHTLAPKVMLVAVPNAGKRSAWEGRTRKREGMVKGFPDMMALHDGQSYFLEFKAGKGRLSDDQMDCLNRLVRLDFPVGVFRSADTAVDWLREHGVPIP